MKKVQGIDLSFADHWDLDDELRIEIGGSTEYLSRAKVAAIRNHLAAMLAIEPGTDENGCWE